MTVPARHSTDLRRALDVVDPAQVEAPGDPLAWTLLQGLADLVHADGACYLEQDPYLRRVLLDQDTDPADADDPAEEDFWPLFWACDACSHPQRSGDFTRVTMISDFYTRSEFGRHPMAELLRATGVKHEAVVPLPPLGTLDRRIMVYRRGGKDFTERDRALLTLLRPHVATLHARMVGARDGVATDLLTPRQWQLLRLVAAGAGNRQIARTLRLSEGTVRKHLENIYARLGVNNRTTAIARAFPGTLEDGLVSAATPARGS